MKIRVIIITLSILIVFFISLFYSRPKPIVSFSSDIYLSKLNGNFSPAVLVDPPISTMCNEDNPSPGEDGFLYFDSNRKDPLGKKCLCSECKSIWVSEYEDKKWSIPEKVSDGWTPFVTDAGKTLYFSGGDFLDDGQCIGSSCLWRRKKTNVGWGKPELVARSKSNKSDEPLIIISEPTLTADKKLLYFVYFDNNQIISPGGANNTQIGVVAKTNESFGFRTGKAIEGLEFEKGWGIPYDLPSSVNTTGSEDSSWITPDGQELYFAYRGQSISERPDQHGEAYDIYVVYPYKNWQINNLVELNSEEDDAAPGLTWDKKLLFFVRWPY